MAGINTNVWGICQDPKNKTSNRVSLLINKNQGIATFSGSHCLWTIAGMARLLFLVKGRLPASQELPREIKCVERASETWRVQLGNSSSEGLGMWLH